VAANEITFKVKVTKDGSLKVVAKEAEKAAKGTEKLGKSTEETTKARNKFNRGEKGVAQAGMNTTKSFSKMRDVMGGGSSGLVGAYATLAANVFALTAAFGILQRAAAAQQLAEGLAYTGTVAGRNLPFIANSLREITGEAVSTQEAMSAVALATSSGFSSEQISRLGEVAKGASLALGRDMTDALNRLVRGAAKLEPELLDELGIMVRLDDATDKYARKLGVTEGNLTQFQKRQAFVNAIIEEGTSSFAGIAEQIEPNAYDQLAASLSDLLKNFITLLNKGLIPVVKFFSTSPTALVGGALLFASTIRGQLLPGLTQGAQRMANFAAESAQAAKASFGNIQTTGKLPEVYTNLSSKIKDGTATTKDFTAAQNSLSASLRKHNSDLEKNAKFQDKSTTTYANKIKTISEVETAQNKLNNTLLLGAKADTAAARATAINAAANLDFKGTVSGIRAAMAAYRLEIAATTIANTGATASFVGLRVALFGAATGFAALGVAILTLLPYLALIPVVIGLGKAAYDKFFGDSETKKKIDEIIDSLDHLNEVGSRLATTLDMIATKNPPNRAWQEFTATLEANAGAAAQVRDRATDIINVQSSAKVKEYTDALNRQAAAQAAVNENTQGGHKKRNLSNELTAANKAVKELKDNFNVVDPAPILTALRASKEILSAQGMDKSVTDNIAKQISDLEKLSAVGEVTAEEVRAVLSQPATVETTSQLLAGMEGSLTSFSEELNKMKEKTSTPFDNMSKALDDTLKNLTQTKKGTDDLTDAAKALAATIDVEGSPLEKAMGRFRIGTEKASETVTRLQGKLAENIKIMQEGPGKIKEQQAELKQLSSLRTQDSSITKKALELEDSILDTKESVLKAELDNYDILTLSEEQSARILEINAKLKAITAERKSEEQKNLEIVTAEVNFKKMTLQQEQKILDAAKSQTSTREKNLRLAAQEAAFADPTRRTTTLTAKEERAIQRTLQKEKKEAIVVEFKIKKALIDAEYDLLDAKQQLLLKQTIAADGDVKAVETYGELLQKARKDSKAALDSAERFAKRANASTLGLDSKAVGEQQAASKVGKSVAERIRNAFSDEVDVFNEQTLVEQIGIINNTIDPMIETFKKLGPEGELSATIIQGAFAVSSAWVDAFTRISDIFHETNLSLGHLSLTAGETWSMMSGEGKMEVMSAAFGAASATISSLASVYSAASQNRIAGIEGEIAAEKKRDGKSAQSLAKIAQLEKKKEQQKKKAFEVNKALMLANAIMSTAAGVAGALSLAGKVPPGVETALAVMIGAMGAAQIAIISGMSYQGGSGGNAKPTPKSIAVGNRTESVDLSKSQSASGELAYFRGERGIGGPENFRPAFYGRKSRAMGGNTGYVVGEQGPELFMPDRPGTIVPADDTAQMGAPMTANINITALDASGVEEILTEQQGNIIGMLREAANSYGQDFFEGVDETIYSTPVARRA